MVNRPLGVNVGRGAGVDVRVGARVAVGGGVFVNVAVGVTGIVARAAGFSAVGMINVSVGVLEVGGGGTIDCMAQISKPMISKVGSRT